MTQKLWRKANKGVPFPGVIAAPPRPCLKMFGGHMDIEEFRASAGKRETHMVTDAPFALEFVQEVDRISTPQDLPARSVPPQPQPSQSAGASSKKRSPAAPVEPEQPNLALKRARPMVNKSCSLDKFVTVVNKKK
eukprot:jgi/Mesvir1/20127/Mv13366-RA.1